MEKDIKSRPRLWVVTECYYPEVVSTGQYLTEIAERLADDFDVKVICGQPNYLSRGTKALKHEIRNNVEIFRAWSTLLDKNVVTNRLVNMITLGLSMFVHSLRRFRKGDRVLVVTAPPNLPFSTAIASLTRGAAYTLLIHDLYPDQLIALEKLSRKSIFAKLLDFGNRWLFKFANKIIVVGRDMHELVQRKTDGLDIPIATIPNWADIDVVRPTPKAENTLLRELAIEDKLVILSAGNIGRPTDIENVAECATLLAKDDRFHFVFVGWGAKAAWLVSEVERKELKNISVVGQKPRSEQIVFLNACDIALVSLAKNMWGTAMPSRTYNVMAAGKPILAIADEGSELSKVIADDDIGWHITPGSPDLMKRTLLEIYDNRDKLKEMGVRARRAAESKYSLNTAVEKYREALR